jgi:antitoxin MazE
MYILSLNRGRTIVRGKIQKWGNSLGIRIPKALAEETAVESESVVDITARNGKIIITPLVQEASSLRELLSRVTEENRHDEIERGAPAGREVW